MSRHKKSSVSGGSRNLRLADQILQDLARMIQRELDVSRVGLITLSGVELTVDYAHAKVFFTVLGAEPEVAEAALNEKAGLFHAQLFKLLHIHTVPRLHFVHDQQMAHGFVMNRLIEHANRPGIRADDELPEAPDDPGEVRG